MITIASTFVAEPFEPYLAWLLGEAGINDAISFAPYHQVFQQLLSPASAMRTNSSGANVFLVRLEDFVRDAPDRAGCDQLIDAVSVELPQAFEQFASRTKLPILLAVLPPSPNVPQRLIGKLLTAAHLLLRRAQLFPDVQIIDGAHVIGASAHQQHDSKRDRLAHIPYTDECYAALALAVARGVHAATNTPAKVLVLDCDNTLWRGVIGEDTVAGIQMTAECLALQDFAIEQQDKGVLICLVSKNTERDVLGVFEMRTDMHLRLKHIVSHRINWLSKPANIRSLAEELNLGLDSFVFLDDNPVECAHMRAEEPQVITIQIPDGSGDPLFLRNLWMFDKLAVTGEDTARTRMYFDNAARRALENSTSDIRQFLLALDMKIDIATPMDDEWQRLEQLTQRTSQFNFTTRRRSVSELRALLHGGAATLRVRVCDRFGDYGIVGLVIATNARTALNVDTFLLSCRVLGRGVEHALLRRLGEIARLAGLDKVSLPFVPTARNMPARAFADSVAADYANPTNGGIDYCMPTAFAAQIVHRPGHDPQDVMQAARGKKESRSAATAPNASGRSEFYSHLAHVIRSGESVLAEMAKRPSRVRKCGVAASSPLSPVEEQLVQLFEALLEIDGAGIDDSFFDLGGTSLLSVKLVAEISRRFNVELPLSTIGGAPTVRSLGQLIRAPGTERQQGMLCLHAGGPRNLFLVHDGLGETLLYHNLARRLPPDMSVYGIEPKRLPGIPLAHTSISAMASFYVEQVRRIQPEGPYLLGGLCAGGVIAYGMAACLNEIGQSVQLVAILDGATPQARRRSGIIARRRLSRVKETVTQGASARRPPLIRSLSIASILIRKSVKAVSYTVVCACQRISVRLRVVLMKLLIERGMAWPKLLTPLSVQEIYDVLASQYKPTLLSGVPVLLVRASDGNGADTPYRELFSGDDLGWSRVASRLELVDVKGGHSSMLQEHAIDSLASALIHHLSISVPGTRPGSRSKLSGNWAATVPNRSATTSGA